MNNLIEENISGFDLPSLDLTRFSAPQTFQTVGEKFLVFLLGAEFYAVSSKKVTEVLASLSVTTLPNAPEWLLGVANLRGEIVPVVDLPKVLRKENTAAAAKPKYIVFDSVFFETGAAFKVDRISEIVTVPNEQIQLGAAADSPHTVGKIPRKSQLLHLIDPEKLLAALTL